MFDYEQIEYRLLAYYLSLAVDDHSMAEGFRAGKDPHAMTTEMILGHCNTDQERQIGKTMNFAIIYAGGVPTILRQMAKAGIECDRKQAKRWLAQLHEGMPGVKQLYEQVGERVDEEGYIFDIFGRRYHPDPHIPYHDAKRKMVNALIQGCAAGFTREAVVKVWKGLHEVVFDSHIVNVVHDELILDCTEVELNPLAELMPGWMGNETVEPVVPITVSMEVSRTSWADKEPYDYIAETLKEEHDRRTVRW